MVTDLTQTNSSGGLVETEDQYRELLGGLARNPHGTIGIDLESTGLRMRQSDVTRGICVAYYGGDFRDEVLGWYLPVSHPDSINFNPTRLISTLRDHQGLTCWHNAAAVDWPGLEQLGLEPPPIERYADVMVSTWLHDENMEHGLKELGEVYFGADAGAEKRHLAEIRKGTSKAEIRAELKGRESWKGRGPELTAEVARINAESKRDWETFTAQDLGAYAANDAVLTLQLADIYHDAKDPVLNRELRFQYVLHRMMNRGIRVNGAEVQKQRDEAERRLVELAAPYSHVLLTSADQVAHLVYEEWGNPVKHRTATGKPATHKEALEDLEDDPRIRDLQEFKLHAKAVSGYYLPLADCLAADGRIHARFSSTRTKTGRLACEDPNLMTIPRGDTLVGVRDVFIAADGYELWEFDLKQAELRVQASFSRDASMQDALYAGLDLHNRTAELVFGADFTGLQRRLAKNLNFGFSYGIGPRKFARYMVSGTPSPVTVCDHWEWSKFDGGRRPARCRSCHVCQAADILQTYRDEQPRLVQLMSGLERIARRDGKLELHVPGRFRHFRSPGKLIHYYTALNAVVQGGVGEFMKDVMLTAEPELDAVGARLCLQVHDALVIEVLPGSGQVVGALLQTVADTINPFSMKMEWTAEPWEAHG